MPPPNPTSGEAHKDREIGTKSIGAMAFTDDDKGEVRAVVYTLGIVDRDGEVVLPEAFHGEAKVKLSEYGHSSILAHARGTGNPVAAPVGKGAVRVNAKNEVEFLGRYFMSTQRGRDAYFTAKEMGPEQEWSFTFWRDSGEPPDDEWREKGARRIWRTPIDPFEVSPVTIAGGIGTRTVGVKGDASEPAEVKDEPPPPPAAVEVPPAELLVQEPPVEDELAIKAVALKAQTAETIDDYHRVQRALRRMGLIA